jgi:serine/threonine protein kinase
VFKDPLKADEEWDESFPLRKIDPKQQYFVYPMLKCKTTKSVVKANSTNPLTSCPFTTTDQAQAPNSTNGENEMSQLISLNGGQTLYDYMTKRYREDGGISFKEFIEIMIKLATALIVLNVKAGYAHQDIKPNNILINDKKEVRLIDFGFMTPNDKLLTLTNPFLGKNYWIHPPEYWVMNKRLRNEPITEANLAEYRLKRLFQLNSVFSDEDREQISTMYTKFWPSLCEVENEYQDLINEKTFDVQKVDSYALGITLILLFQFVNTKTISQLVYQKFNNIVRSVTRPKCSKRYSITEAHRALTLL